MTRGDVNAALKKISANYSEMSVCGFLGAAKNDEILGFVDTSQEQNGTWGIVFMSSKAVLNFDGSPRVIPYEQIHGIQIISSFEDAFTDELNILCGEYDVRVSDCSLHKAELRRLLDELRADDRKAREHKAQAEKLAAIIADNLAENALHTDARSIISEPIPQHKETPQPEPQNAVAAEMITVDIPEITREDIPENTGEKIPENVSEEVGEELPEKTPEDPAEEKPEENLSDIVFEEGAPVILEIISEPIFEAVAEKTPAAPKNYEPAPIPEGRVDWINGNLASAVLEKPVETAKPAFEFEVVNGEAPDSDTDELIKIQNMSHEETMNYLAQSWDEINAPATVPEPQTVPAAAEELRTISDYSAPIPEEEPKTSKLTVEPIWGDIYIKASRNLRELCESGKLSMEQIEAELSARLLDSARAFAEITADGAKLPKVLIPKITELKVAANDFEQYFQLGEDIAVRSMFFMLYQMLSYADRIAETPETKERLNNFFRRFGPAGITLSMLDMRI